MILTVSGTTFRKTKFYEIQPYDVLEVQLSKNRNSYKTRFFKGYELYKAVDYFKEINIPYGFKKRLSLNGKIIATWLF